MEKEELENAVLEAQLRKNSTKILYDAAKGGVKSIEVKCYAEKHANAVRDAVDAIRTAIEELESQGFKVEK